MRDDDSIETLLLSLRKLTDDAEFFQELGKLFQKQGVMDAAKACYDVSLELDPCDAFTHLFLGNWYYRLDDCERAIECFKLAAELMPENATPYWTEANIYEKQGRDDLADEYYRRAAEVDPNDRLARRQLRRWWKRHKGWNER